MPGILDVGRNYRQTANDTLSKSADIELSREAANKQLKAQAKAQTASTIGMFVGLAGGMF